ncbi:glutamate-cysteine ligase family protein [Candidatus Neomarinimicrobiota bacterium]
MTLNDRIKTVILSNIRPPEKCLIGLEVECLFYDKDLMRIPANPCECFSANEFLREMEKKQVNDSSKASFSLEPGGQLEWASYPELTINDLHEQYEKHLRRIQEICKDYALRLIDFAVDPLFEPELVELIDQEKYRLMFEHFKSTGTHGSWMMRNTTSVQINLDFSSLESAERMAYIADCLEPFTALLFAHSPFMQGKPVGTKNLRYIIWNNTDDARCKNLIDHGIKNSVNLLDRYIDYILTVPALFITDEKGNYQRFAGTFHEWFSILDQKNELTDENISLALHQIFTNVRFKNVLEIRGSDRPPLGFEMAPATFWTGLLLSDKAQEVIFEVVNNWSITERLKLNKTAEILDLSQEGPRGKPLIFWLEKIIDIALIGLNERSRILKITNESKFLIPFVDRVLNKSLMSLQIQNKLAESNLPIDQFLINE